MTEYTDLIAEARDWADELEASVHVPHPGSDLLRRLAGALEAVALPAPTDDEREELAAHVHWLQHRHHVDEVSADATDQYYLADAILEWLASRRVVPVSDDERAAARPEEGRADWDYEQRIARLRKAIEDALTIRTGVTHRDLDRTRDFLRRELARSEAADRRQSTAPHPTVPKGES